MTTDPLGPPADNNDIRAALGANGVALRMLREDVEAIRASVDDIGAAVLRLANLATFLDDIKSVVEVELPAALDNLASDPLLGTFIGPYISTVKSALTGGLLRAQQDRTSPPAIEG
jgi:hypothetical protein